MVLGITERIVRVWLPLNDGDGTTSAFKGRGKVSYTANGDEYTVGSS